MDLISKINADIKAAMIAKDASKLAVLRMLKASLTNLAIENKGAAPDESAIIVVVRKNIKTREDSVSAFEAGHRSDLAAKEKAEIQILRGYLPPEMSESDLVEIINAVILKLNATSKKDTGRVIKEVVAQVAPRADGRTISALVGRLLP